MRTLYRSLLALVLSSAFVACGSGTSLSTPPNVVEKTARVSFSITIPHANASASAIRARDKKPDYVSPATQSVAIVVSDHTSAQSPPVILNCSSGQTCSTALDAAVDTDTFLVTAYAGTGGKGAALGTGSMKQTIVLDAANVVRVTLGGIVDHFVSTVSSATVVAAGTSATETVAVSAVDASGNTIVAPGGYVDATGVAVTGVPAVTNYGNGYATVTLVSPTAAPSSGPYMISAPGTVLTYTYDGLDIDRSVFVVASSSAATNASISATIDYVPTFAKRFVDTLYGDPSFITTGPDGNIWFTDRGTGALASVVPSTGAITHYAVSAAQPGSGEPEAIVAGPSNTMYFADYSNSAIGSISTSTAASLGSSTPITEIPLTTIGASPRGIAYDATCDANVWFTEFNGNKIGKLSTSTMLVTEYTTGLTANSNPDQIACGPDGNFWFTEFNANKIGQITPAGTIVEYALPQPSSDHEPIGIVRGPEGSMWFAEYSGNAIGRISTSKTVPAQTVGTIAEIPLPSAPSNPQGKSLDPTLLAFAPDGDLFIALGNALGSNANAAIGRLTTTASVVPGSTSGVFTSYPLDAQDTIPYGITIGPDRHVWYTDAGRSSIGYVIY